MTTESAAGARPASGLVGPDRAARLNGLLLGTAVGDALGLPVENLSPGRRQRMVGEEWRHRFICNRGFVSDDTEHAAFVGASLLAHDDDPDAFARALAWRLRVWLLMLPGGVGFATLQACLKLWCGFSPARSGVFSAGNGPAMRASLIGAYFADDPERRRAFVDASTRMTHTHPHAFTGARAIAEVAAAVLSTSAPLAQTPERVFIRVSAIDLFRRLETVRHPDDREWPNCLARIEHAWADDAEVLALAATMGQYAGISGYIHHTVPLAIYGFIKHRGDFRATVSALLDCGGDTDTVGAIAGALVGASVGEAGIPREWVAGVADWPLSRRYLRRLAAALCAPPGRGREAMFAWPALPLRNAFFLFIVSAHGLRRLLPPY